MPLRGLLGDCKIFANLPCELQAALTNSFSSSHTDDLSTLGVPVDSRDEVDCLGGVLEQLEPSLEVKRRSRNFDRENRRR